MMMRRGYRRGAAALLTAALMALSGQAISQEPGDALAKRIVAEGNGRGAAGCASCHGDAGQGMAAAGFPRLAGLDAAYIKAQLEHFKAGARTNASMAPMGKALSAEEIAAVSAYYAALPAQADAAPAADAAALAAGEQLARYGRWSDDIPACASCHGASGLGLSAAFPAIAGQSAVYITAQLEQWRRGERKGDPNDLMGSVARRLTDADIAAVSAYFASRPVVRAAEVKP